MSRPLTDNSKRFFGRQRDLAALRDRVATRGITAVVGRPQIGKSWLLEELARRLVQEEPRPLVGFAESKGETPDLLLRAIEDLYARWLDGASWSEQARQAWEQQRKNLLPGVAAALGAIFDAAARTTGEPTLTIVKSGLDGLAAANRDLRSGGLNVPTLQYDQARDLLRALHGITGRPAVLVLDQWEKSPELAREAQILDGFVRHALEEWPPCHVVLGLRSTSDREDERAALREAERFVAIAPGRASIHRLSDWPLDDGEAGRLLLWLRGAVPGTADASDDALLEMIGDFPGVVRRWVELRSTIRGIEDLHEIARAAHAYRYPELEASLKNLSGDLRTLAIRLVLLPQGGGELWPSIRDVVLDGLDEWLLDDLRWEQVLLRPDPIDFGHAKRFEVARSALFAARPRECGHEAERLVRACGARITGSGPAVAPFALVLREHAELGAALRTSDLARAACDAAATLFRDPVARGPLDRAAGIVGEGAGLAPLLATGLVNTLVDAKAEDDLPRRDALLDELRSLARAHPDDAAVRERIAMGLYNTLNHATAEDDLPRRDALLDELRALAQAHPEDAAVRGWLAKGLFNTLNHAKAEDDLPRRDALLDELRALAQADPDDAAVREQLAMGLNNTLVDAEAEGDLSRRDALLDELRSLAKAHPGDASVREWFAKGLANTILGVEQEGAADRSADLRTELRALAEAHPDDGWVMPCRDAGLIKRNAP